MGSQSWAYLLNGFFFLVCAWLWLGLNVGITAKPKVENVIGHVCVKTALNLVRVCLMITWGCVEKALGPMFATVDTAMLGLVIKLHGVREDAQEDLLEEAGESLETVTKVPDVSVLKRLRPAPKEAAIMAFVNKRLMVFPLMKLLEDADLLNASATNAIKSKNA